MDTSAIDKLIGEMRAVSAGGLSALAKPKSAGAPDFAALLQASLNSANSTQLEASHLARSFELGAPNTSLSDVMISMQKANLSFQQMVQVRNRLVAAYHDIMNMQV
jgi:flagellar hook-basal body complex protein FliE